MFDLKQLLDQHEGQSLSLIEQHINPVFAKVLRVLGYDIEYVRGQGQYLWDRQGNRYIDCLSGFGTFGVGRNHPVIRDALKQAMDLDLPNLPKFGPAPLSGILAEQLVQLTPGDLDTVFFCNSGAEAVETALKYARAATGRERVVHCNKGFHGLTFGALAVTATEFREGFGRSIVETTAVPFNDLDALEHELRKGDVAAFIVEPIQGKGVFVADDDYLPAVQQLCRKYGTLLIADEVQTGFGRTGKMFACEHYGVEPDIMTTAKALSGGYVPVAAVFSKRWIHKKVFSSLDRVVVHSTTFGQNDLAMAAGLATLHVLKEEKIVENAAAMGERLRGGLQQIVNDFELAKEVRGKGLMVGLELGQPTSFRLKMAWKMIHAADKGLFPQAVLIPLLHDHHIFALVAGHNLDVIKLLPSLVINEGDVDHIVHGLRETLAACHKFPGPVWQITRRLSSVAMGRHKSTEPATT